MEFFKQTKSGTCDIIAIQHVLSYLGKERSFEEIENKLKRHSFGTWLPDVGTYFEGMGIKTRLISNRENFKSSNKGYEKALDRYRSRMIFEDRIPIEADIKDKPVIINVDVFKIRNQEGGPGTHYVVVLRENGTLYMYDGQTYNEKVEVDFEALYRYSLNVCDFLPNGMWLIIE